MIQRYAQFCFFRKGHAACFSSYILIIFLRKIFPMLYSINWPNSIFTLPLILEILGNMCIIIICFSVYDVINFETNLSVRFKCIFLMTKKKLGQKSKYLKNEKTFLAKRLPVARNCLCSEKGFISFAWRATLTSQHAVFPMYE